MRSKPDAVSSARARFRIVAANVLRLAIGFGAVSLSVGCASSGSDRRADQHAERDADIDARIASIAIRRPVLATPRATFEAALKLLAAGQLPTIEAVRAAVSSPSGQSAAPLTSIAFDQDAPCTSVALRLGDDGVPAETLRSLCTNGRIRRITLIRNDAVRYGSNDMDEPMSESERSGAYPDDREFGDLARRLGLTVVDVTNSASLRAARPGHMQTDDRALLITSSEKGAPVIRADTFPGGIVVGIYVLARRQGL